MILKKLKSASENDITLDILNKRENEYPLNFKITHANKTYKRLTENEIFNYCYLSDEHVEQFYDKEPDYDIVSQERAVRAISVGLGIDKPSYNIYVAGAQGTGKTSVIRSFLQKTSKNQPIPGDWVYVYNFKTPENPKAIGLETGLAKKFKKDMDELIDILEEEITTALQSEEYENKVNIEINTNNDKKTKLFNELEKNAKTMNFGIKSTRMGIVTVPIVDSKPLSEKEYSDLSEEQKDEIERLRNELEPEVLDFARKVRTIEHDTKIKVDNLRNEVGDKVVSENLEPLLKEYANNKNIIDYLTEVKEHILENLMMFLRDKETEEDEETEENNIPRSLRKVDQYVMYRINIFIDNTDSVGAPIIIENNPTYYNLFGKIEKNIEYGIYTTDFKMIKAGSLARANGGYIVLNAHDIFKSQHLWDTLKRVMKNQKLYIEDLGEQYSLLATSGLRPEPIPLNVKIVLIGSDWIYRTLYQLDEDFNRIFKIKADFDVEMQKNSKHIDDYIKFVTSRSKIENLLSFDASALNKIIEYSSRTIDEQNKLTTRFSIIKDLTIEANFMAKERGANRISDIDIEKAIDERYYRSSLVEDHVDESIKRGDVLISTNSRRIGEINALVVYDLGDISFGKPTRVTCRVFRSKPGLLNIEREASLSGKLHNKGISILQSWIHATFGRFSSIMLSASLCFEQNYSGVDGDSASMAEMILLISTVAKIPLDQSIAITGSVNQFGEAQPIGGVNEKIEGFFKVCSMQGLTGRQGVIIPIQNVKNLMLNRKVREAVANNQFHIWPISKVEEAFELLTGCEAGEWDEKESKFTKKSAFERIYLALHNKLDKKKNKNTKKEKSKVKPKAKATKSKTKR